MGRLILNCDLGEDEPIAQTERILSLVDAVNIGCGFHAGSEKKTRSTIERAFKSGVRIGAHPGLPLDGGRGNELPTPEAFHDLLVTQIGSFQAVARSLGTAAEYIKLHGSLYHAVEAQPDLAEVYVQFLLTQSPKLAVFALAGGSFASLAEAVGIRVYHEAFADRAYQADGTLLPRSKAGAVLDFKQALERIKIWLGQGSMPTHDGQLIELSADTLCVHGDSTGAFKMITELRALL